MRKMLMVVCGVAAAWALGSAIDARAEQTSAPGASDETAVASVASTDTAAPTLVARRRGGRAGQGAGRGAGLGPRGNGQAGSGNGPGDGSGNAGQGPQDGTGNGAGGGSGDCDGAGPKGAGRGQN
jgi:hypothetical protein